MKKGRKFIKKRKTIPNFAPNQVFNGSLNRCKVLRTIAYVLILVVVFTGATLTAFAAETDPYAVQTTAVSGGYETLTIDSSVLNGSTIYGSGDSEYSLDKDGGFYSSAWKNYGNLPDSGRITVGSVPYQFTWTGNSPYAGKDSIRLSSASPVNTTSKTMVLKQYGVYDKIYILGTAAGFANSSSSLSFTVNLNYTDGTFSQTTYKLGDWYRDSAVDNEITLYTGLYRKDVKPDYNAFPNGYTVGGRGPSLQSMAIDCDETKLLSSIEFTMNTKTETSGGTTYYLYSGIYAVTGKVSDSAPATPDLYEITDADITSNSFTAKWDSASNATKYYLDVATDSSFENMLTGYSNKDIGNVTEYKVEGLTTGTTYYYRVRSANNAGQSLSSTVRTVVPEYKKLPSPELSYENTVVVGGETYLQTVSWPVIESAVNYIWSIEITDENGTVSTYTGDLNQAGADGSVYLVTAGSKYLLNFTNLVDGIGEYKVSVVAEPVENSDRYLSSDKALKTVNIAFPNVTVDVTDELKASGIVSGIGGDCEKSITDGVLTLTAKNANEYSELGVWYKSSVVFDTGVSTSLTADEQYGDTYKLIFDINRNKLELSDDGNGKFTLKLLDDIVLEQDLVFGKDIILDLNRNNITTNTNSTLEVEDVVLNVRNGHLTDTAGGTEKIINTIGNGVVIVENSVVMNGLVGGAAEVSWNESNGDRHYATMNDALTGGEGKEADANSTLSLIKDKELTEDLIIPESITIHIPDGNKLSVAENVMLTNKGTIVTDGEIINAGTIKNTEAAILKNEGVVANTTTGEIYNEGSIDNNSGQIDNAGLFGGEGTIDNENGKITSLKGILQNQINNGPNGQIISEASWNEDGKKYYGPIDEAIESATNNTDEKVIIIIESDISIAENVTIPENVTLVIPADKTLTVPEGITLDNNGEIVEVGALQVSGDIESNASWTDGHTKHYSDLNTALDNVKSGESVTLLEDLIWMYDAPLEIPQDVDFVIPNDVVLEIEKEKLVNVENIKSETLWKSDENSNKISFGSLEQAIEESTSNVDNNVDIIIRDDVVLEENITIPEGVNITINEGASLTVPDGKEIENNGTITNNGTLTNNGTIDNNGSISNAGVIDNVSGTEIGGELSGAGHIIADSGAFGHGMSEATCTEPSKCLKEGCTYTEGTALGHDMSEATCTEASKCQREGCNHTGETALGHDMSEATCTEASKCQREGCNHTVGTALGHDMSEATCTEASKCQRDGCNHIVGTALGHDMSEATCTEASKCQREGCNHTVGTALGHDMSEVTCTEASKCQRDGCNHTVGTALGHDMSEATCTEASKCQRDGCNHTVGTVLGHDMSEVTCTEASKCQRDGCNHTVGTALGHDMSEATCTEASKCQRDGCNHTEGTALGHDMSEATCTEVSKCQREGCNHTEGTALGHDMSEATCTEASKCQREGCNHTEGTALGHDMSEATCTEASKCQREGCNHTEGTALGHDMSEATCTEASKCQRQGCNYTVGTSLGHDWSGEWTVVKEATKTEEGKKETLCLRGCGQKKVVVIPATGTTVDNDNFEKSVELESDNPIDEATLDNSEDELLNANKIFTTTEKQDIKNGADAKVWIEISDTDFSTISSDVKNKIEQKVSEVMGDNQNAIYFEADLFKQVGNGIVKEIREPGVAIKITIKIPTELINTDATITREYKLIRTHEGQNNVEVDIIDGTFDPATEEFMFKTDKFSTYAIVYTDTPVEDKNDNGETDTDDVVKPDSNQKDEVPKTGGSNVAMYSFTLMFISGLGIVLISRKRKTYCKEN